MVIQSYLKYLLTDCVSLNSYYQRCEPVSLEDVKRSLMLIEQNHNLSIPDHYYRLGQENSFQKIFSLGELFTTGLYELAKHYLEWNPHEKRIYVKAEKQNEWQLLLPYLPPLLMQALVLWKEVPLDSYPTFSSYISQVLIQNFSYTAIPNSNIQALKQLLESNGGLYDLHIHLNGTLETDFIWQDYMKNPDIVYRELKQAQQTEKVMEQYIQQTPFLSPDDFRKLLYIARFLREYICNFLFNIKEDPNEPGIYQKCSFTQFLDRLHEMSVLQKSSSMHHPVSLLLNLRCSPVCAECLFYLYTFQYIKERRGNDDVVSSMFHYYLLILGQVNTMLVQPPDRNGFEEFQKYTLNEFRSFSERTYFRRFFQLAGNELKNIRMIEGRFAPKETLGEDEKILNKIRLGWENFEQSYREKQENEELHPVACKLRKPKLKLVAHFIKTVEKSPDPDIRFREKRQDLMRRAEALVYLKESGSENSKLVCSIDAASSEFDTPPEVFSCCYRYLRNAGYRHFTFHVGEDFFHILSGLRAIYEAVMFLNLQRTDRIGHATACGVSAEVWLANMGKRMLIRRGEYLDDLIFAFYLINQSDDAELKAVLPSIANRIETLCFYVYDKYYPIALLIEAWKKRHMDPEKILTESLKQPSPKMNPAEQLFLIYHRQETVKKYNEIMDVGTEELLDCTQLTKLQWLVLKFLHEHEIVIETLPTSNVIIGHHHSFETYHLYNWYQWKKAGHSMPPIVVGSDDAGIFATNIYNEYSNIYCQMHYLKKMNLSDIIDFIRELDYNSRLYKFD